MFQVRQWLQQGLQHQQRNEFDAALRCYESVLATDPRNPDALHLSGLIALRRGAPREAVALIKRAIKANPRVADFHCNLGEALRLAGKAADARDALRAALRIAPDHVLSLNNLGLVHRHLGQPIEARRCLEQALARRPDYFEARLNLGQLLSAEGDFGPAIEHLQRARALRPELAATLLQLAETLRKAGRTDEALVRYDAFLAASPDDPVALTNRGECLRQLGRLAEARDSLLQAIRIAPDLAPAHNTLGVVAAEQNDIALARSSYEQALALAPDFHDARLNLAILCREQRDTEQAIAQCDAIVKASPRCAEALFERGMARLLQGDWPLGWRDYEWRYRSRYQNPLPKLASRMWKPGETPPAGCHLLLLTEQGFGDNLMAWRWIAPLRERFAHITLQAPVPLAALARHVTGVDAVCAPDEFPPHDLHCPIMSLPQRLGIVPHAEGVARTDPYCAAPAERRPAWRERIAALGPGPKIGLCWSGSSINPANRRRQLGLATLSPLIATPGTQWISLQKDLTAADRERLAHGEPRIHDWMAEVHDFADTAALVAELDLVVGLDSAVVHLAGALGHPVWTFVPWLHDWRWFGDADTPPWYPTMRLFRQRAPGDWAAAIDDACKALRDDRAAAEGPRGAP